MLCREAAKREPVDGSRAFNLIRRAVGHEIVSRLYRLINKSPDAASFPKLIQMLNDNTILMLLMPSFNHDGRKSFEDLVGIRDGVEEQFESILNS